MNAPFIMSANGRRYDLPMTDPIVAARVSDPSSCCTALVEQINDSTYYRQMFCGKVGMTFLDLGANIGLVSIYAVDSCSRIVAVEPDPETFKVLKANTWQFKNIETIQAAIAPKDGVCEFFQNNVNTTASSTVNTYGTKTEVRGVTIPSLLREAQLESVDFCKMDVEGAEGESLDLGVLLELKPIVKSWYVETHNCPKTTWEHKLGTIVGNMLRAGYKEMEVHHMALYVRG